MTKHAGTVGDVADIPARVDRALRLAAEPHRGPVFLDFALEALFSQADAELPDPDPPPARQPDPDALAAVARLLGEAERPVLVLGSDVWADRAEDAARRCAEALALPVVANGQGRGILAPGGDGLLVTRARSLAFGAADLVVVAGARSTSGSATAASAAATAGPRPGWCTWSTPPARWPGTWSWPGAWPATSAWSLTAWPRRWPPSPAAGPTPGPGAGACATRPWRRSPATASCWTATPTRSTRPGSTASSCGCWPTTRW